MSKTDKKWDVSLHKYNFLKYVQASLLSQEAEQPKPEKIESKYKCDKCNKF